jgi:hypothetical protein
MTIFWKRGTSTITMLMVFVLGSWCSVLAQGARVGCAGCAVSAGNAVDNSPSAPSNPQPAHTASSSASHSKAGSSSGDGGGGGNPAADIHDSMYAGLARDNAARDKEKDGLAATGAVAASNLDAAFTNATSSPEFSAQNQAASNVSGSQATSDSDFAIPTPSPNEGMSAPAPVADATPSMQMAPMHDPGYTDVLPIPAGTAPPATQVGADSSNRPVTGIDATQADLDAWKNAQATDLLVKPMVNSVVTGVPIMMDIATDGVSGAVVKVVQGAAQDAVLDPVKEAGEEGLKESVVNVYHSYVNNLGNTTTLPSPTPGPTPNPKPTPVSLPSNPPIVPNQLP